ncbi:MAG: hypothetical protein RML72_07545 [Bacteroidia bacterium]|nr:hypothetical protein [Bacteroidia bacterium]
MEKNWLKFSEIQPRELTDVILFQLEGEPYPIKSPIQLLAHLIYKLCLTTRNKKEIIKICSRYNIPVFDYEKLQEIDCKKKEIINVCPEIYLKTNLNTNHLYNFIFWMLFELEIGTESLLIKKRNKKHLPSSTTSTLFSVEYSKAFE